MPVLVLLLVLLLLLLLLTAHCPARAGKEGHVRLLLDGGANIRAESIVSVGQKVRAPNEAQVPVRIAAGATALHVVAAAIEAIASTKAGASTIGTGVLSSKPVRRRHSLDFIAVSLT